jgi:hypothetical protein
LQSLFDERRPAVHEADRFAYGFADEQEAEAEARRPLEAEGEAEEPDYSMRGPDFGELPERTSPGVLPMAVMALVGILIGFGAGYFVFVAGSREREGASTTPATQTMQPASPAPAAQSPSPAPAAPAAREFSDQAVTPPRAEPPPPVSEPAPSSGSKAAPPRTAAAAPPRETPPPAARRGRLVVQSTPPRAGVTVNGQWRGRTPLTLEDLAFGHYVVRIVQPGFKVAREDFTLGARDAAYTMNARLEREAAAPSARPSAPPAPQKEFTGSLFVDSRPQGASVLLDGNLVGRTPLMLTEVKIGMHVVRLDLAEHKPFSSTARIISGQEARVTASLERYR